MYIKERERKKENSQTENNKFQSWCMMNAGVKAALVKINNYLLIFYKNAWL